MLKLARYNWVRDPNNPVLPPIASLKNECTCCMNPYVVRADSNYRLFYAGADKDGHRRICMATAPVNDPTCWTRYGIVMDLGEQGKFDASWCVLPLVHRFRHRWHLYWSGFEGSNRGLQSFPGIGLAFSDDGIHFERYSDDAVITGDQTPDFPRNRGVAGGGTIIEDVLPDGSIRYRMYYTLATGATNSDVHVDQEKHIAVCHSADGISWTDHRVIMSPRRDVPHEDIASAAPFVWRDGELYRMIYSAIGTRWGCYSLAEAVSGDGYDWDRGEGDTNLTLAPAADDPESWEQQMVEYPAVISEGDRLRLFYCGNGYGATGIGTATATTV